MKMSLNIGVLLLACICVLDKSHAEAYTPTDPNTLIASWTITSSPALQQAQTAKRLQPGNPAAVVTLANNYLALAAMPGQSRLYGLAQAALKPLIETNTDNAQVWLAWAQVLQHQHAFNKSLEAIAKVIAQEPKNSNANLLAARIYLIQDNPAQARQACLKLLGYSDLLTTSTCILEITSHPNNELSKNGASDSIGTTKSTGIESSELQESYNQLVVLVKREGMPNDERGPWIAQVLADMAMRLGNPKAAEEWLTPQLANATVNYLAQWSDTQFAQNNSEKVTSYLTPIVKAAAEADDLLLLQLALAEKKSANPAAALWQQQLAERIALREQRQDDQHANELARYYLDINPQPKKALYWAQQHWQNSREYNDKKLLDRAQAAVAAQRVSSQQESQ